MVSSIILFPVNPKRAPHSPIIISANEAKLAVTPPNVGSQITEIKSNPFLLCSYTAADVLAICNNEMIPSCILAPPEAENDITGKCFLVANRKARAIFSPATHPILPNMNVGSIAIITHS